MNIKIIAIGKIKENYLKEGINEYLKRIKPYANISIVEVNDSPIKDNPNQSDINKAKDSEGKKALDHIKNNDYVITLDMNKKEFDSIEFSSYLIKKLEQGGSNLTFLIGGSYGLSDELKARANDSFSLSKMTFLHQMTRLILLEQIYRGFKIYSHETYHK
ncbi:MAG TPA: 23S rRNA (pseudouridine(1915)-N(3))-methyltransferase RlmH [Firmicutes bacterium]|nr:23S rRNA (pseudouridine(1915)-N(3))-methyltransferase RlmH [Bacillota bacterium]